MEGQVISDNGENRKIVKRMKGRDSGDRDNREDTGMEGGERRGEHEGGDKSEKWRRHRDGGRDKEARNGE